MATVSVSPSASPLVMGGSVTLTATLTDAAGKALSGRTIAWSSGATSVAAVSSSGVVTGVAPGTATITATSEGKSGTASVTVSNAFNPQASTTLSGAQRFESINIPAGVTVTVTSGLDLSASGTITIAGTLAGNCVDMKITADAAASVTGTISNACSDPNADGVDLTIIGKGGIAVRGSTINTSGNVLLTNDATLKDSDFPTPLGALMTAANRSRARASVSVASSARTAAPDCAFSFVRPAPPPARTGAPSEKQFLGGAAGKGFKMTCRGTMDLGGGPPVPGAPPPGATIAAQTGGDGGPAFSQSNTFAEARAGDGNDGGSIRIYATGDLTISGVTNLISGNGGDGGDASAEGKPNPGLNKQPSAQATGGRGGQPGLVDIRVDGSIDVNAGLNFIIGHAGDGGDADAAGAPGLDATDTSPAKEGGDANPTGGEGGSTPNRTLVASGDIEGINSVTVTGGRPGNAGYANGIAGVGGSGNDKFMAGAKGGSFSFNTNAAGDGDKTRVGNGGNALLKDLNGQLVAQGGNGSVTKGTLGNGGKGAPGCGIPRKPGGVGGMGGSAVGRDGKGGIGARFGADGGITFTNVGNGGNGGDGVGPGAGGKPGSDASTASGGHRYVGRDFLPGLPGNPCPPIPVRVSVKSDPNGHEPFVGYTKVNAVNVFGGSLGGTIGFSGASPWVTVSGTIDANGNFTVKGTGTVAGFANVPITFSGTISPTGAITGTIQIGQSTAPTGLPNGPVTYDVTPGGA